MTSWALLAPTASTGLPPVWLYRGYTGHEMLDQFGLINMNGRVYDPVLGRMLSPDNYILDGGFTQDYNRYSYARNNPLIYTDPDGNNPLLSTAIGAVIGGVVNGISFGLQGKGFLNGFWRGAITGAIAGLTGYYAPIGAAGGFAYGAASGALTGGVGAALNGTNVWRGIGWGAALGGLSGGIYGGIEAKKLGADWLTGARSDHAYLASDAILSGGTQAPYNDDYLYKLKNENWKGMGPGGKMTTRLPKDITMDADGFISSPTIKDAIAITRHSPWKNGMSSKIFFGKAAFSSGEQLTVSMAHEFGHIVHANLGLMDWAKELTGNPSKLLNNEGHIAIQKMTGQLILKNGWSPKIISSQVWNFNNAQAYDQLYKPLQFLIKKIVLP
ncbi:RHS repeat-associated core domain-containing protein [Dyadobacter sp. CY312]|uniref:RHS repeat-associated core domain-containing protein n=1 Tax=Dyadobacter sp. CY312 TaxID=2907303 RepID=UPI001F4409DE|nr:RHS repeat-associated core domain-containing protein [Dyadobacter sp. CY312]MCE7043811.1 RHS repeat-associated core domain-containing protein [Dyadobacter sp. CY312]